MVSTDEWLVLVKQGNLAALQALSADGWRPESEATSPLAMAALHAHPELVRWFLDIGLIPDHTRALSALHCACSGKASPDRSGVIDMLLKAGADINALNPADRTPLMCASAVGNIDTIEHLLAHGASWHKQNESCKTARDFFATGTRGASEQLDGIVVGISTAPAKGRPRKSTRL